MTFGEARAEQARVHDLEDVKKILDVFQAHGHTEVGVTRDRHLRIRKLIYYYHYCCHFLVIDRHCSCLL